MSAELLAQATPLIDVQVNPNLARYLRNRSASLVDFRCSRDTLKSARPASEVLLLRWQIRTTYSNCTRSNGSIAASCSGPRSSSNRLSCRFSSDQSRLRRPTSDSTASRSILPPGQRVAIRVTLAAKSRKLPCHDADGLSAKEIYRSRASLSKVTRAPSRSAKRSSS